MKIVLAYSGGLDTSIALSWLQETYGAQVVAFCANLGQYEDLSHVRDRAIANGASEVFIDDMREEFIRDYAFPAMRAGGLYEGKYHMAASIGRPAISRKLVEIAHRVNADAIAHGATGKGNDQVRFYSSVTSLDPSLKIIAPVIDWDLTTRSKQLEYAKARNIEVPAFKSSPYSRDSNLWGTSVECGPLDDISQPPPEEVYNITKGALEISHEPREVTIHFNNGIPVSIDEQLMKPHELVDHLNKLGGSYGIGRVDIIENRLVGFKVRGVYESPAAEILHNAARELENLVLERDHLHFRTLLSQKYAELIYDGRWFSGLRNSLDEFFNSFSDVMTGSITLRLSSGRLEVISRESPYSLYNLNISSYESDEGFDQRCGQAFSYIWSMQGRVSAMASKSFPENEKAEHLAVA